MLREKVLYLMRTEKHVYEDSGTPVRCAVGVTEAFNVGIGIYQG